MDLDPQRAAEVDELDAAMIELGANLLAAEAIVARLQRSDPAARLETFRAAMQEESPNVR